MRIAINALSAVAGGGVTYLNQLFKHLSEIDRKNEYLIITTKKGEKILHASYKNFQILSFQIPSLSTTLRLIWEQLFLWYVLKKNKANILYSPANVGLIFLFLPYSTYDTNSGPFFPGDDKKTKCLLSAEIQSFEEINQYICKEGKKCYIYF